ncbi:DUF6889 family protein [Methylobacterium sp. J-090]|uniref:DUF6889 family protein n=1 Tax=Methylobacterium sp. J-090 TaxID=2836666 RepID=UPI00391CD44A
MDNLTAFFSYEPAKIERRGAKGPSFKSVSLPGGRSWLLRPALRGVCRFESLVDGTLDLPHVALMNDALTIDAENESRARKAAEDARAK